MSDDLDQVLADLAAVQDAILALPPEDFAGRFELRQRQEDLRERARELRHDVDDSLTVAQLRAQLNHLLAVREEHFSHRLGHAAAAQTGQGGGIDPAVVHEMHRQMDQAFRLEDLEEEIDHLQDRLKALDA